MVRVLSGSPPKNIYEIGRSPLSTRHAPSSQQIHRIQRTLGRLFVLEVGEDIAARGEMLVDAGAHRLAFFGGVSGFAVTVVRKIGGDYVGSVALFRFGHTERDVPLAQRVARGVDERWLAQPRFVAELERRAHRSRQAFQKF